MTVNTIYVHNDSHDSCHSWILVRPPLKLLGDALLALETPGGNAGFVSMWADTTRILVIVYFMGLYGLFIGWVYVYMAWFIWSCFFCVMFIVQKNCTYIYTQYIVYGLKIRGNPLDYPLVIKAGNGKPATFDYQGVRTDYFAAERSINRYAKSTYRCVGTYMYLYIYIST